MNPVDLRRYRDPSPAMLKAAWSAMNATPSGEWKRLKASGASSRELFDAKMIPRWQAMVDHIVKSEDKP